MIFLATSIEDLIDGGGSGSNTTTTTTTTTTSGGTKVTNISCKAFDFNFSGANIDGNVVINIPNTGEVFCGLAGTTSGGSSYTNITNTQTQDAIKNSPNTTYMTATKNANGTYTT